jgi:DnaJ-domain-containing protein 1
MTSDASREEIFPTQTSDFCLEQINSTMTLFLNELYFPQIITDLPHADLNVMNQNLSDSDEEIDHEMRRLANEANPEAKFS